MADENEKLAEQVKILQKDMEELRTRMNDKEPMLRLEERVENIEEANPEAFALDPFTPDMSRSGDLPDTRQMPTSELEGFQILPFDIEFGKPTGNITSDAATVTLQPCEQDGSSFASADTVTVYVGTDRQSQSIKGNGWTTSTVLSYIRFAPYVSGSPVIEGVLIGERPGAGLLPTGLILMWSGAVANIPNGWVLCDGNNGTPDLRGRFVVGSYVAGGVTWTDGAADELGEIDEYGQPGDYGGKAWHGQAENNHYDHQEHYHPLGAIVQMDAPGVNVDAWAVDNSGPVVDSGGDPLALSHDGPLHSPGDTDNRPPWYCVAYIMKL